MISKSPFVLICFVLIQIIIFLGVKVVAIAREIASVATKECLDVELVQERAILVQ